MFDLDGWKAFRRFLGTSLTVDVTRQYMRVLYDLGTSGPDKDLRDWLYENEIDKRSVSDIIAARWWPTDMRHLAKDLHVSERRRFLKEVDGYLRCIDRLGALPAAPLPHLYLTEMIAERTRYQRLSRLCVGMEMLTHGHPHLVVLRRAQTDLYSRVWPPSPSQPSSQKRVIAEVEALLNDLTSRYPATEWSASTVGNHRKSLILHHDLLASKGRAISFDKSALDIFADHALNRLEHWEQTNGEKGWCRRSVATYCAQLGPFIQDIEERRKWSRFTNRFWALADKNGDPKAKERALCERPMSLEDYFRRAHQLIDRANNTTNVQVRRGLLTVAGVLGILLVFPLRRGDLCRLIIGDQLSRNAKSWMLDLGWTKKSGTRVEPLVLPEEVSPFLDACLLQGTEPRSLWRVYRERSGAPFLESPKRAGEAYSLDALSTLVARHSGHGPHVLRTIWADTLVARGADREVIAAMLQHKNPLSQEAYEFLARKIRLREAARALRDLADQATAA
ncbi:tyrosine-type recombinase/integrase [Roseovarius sp. TE539]|uniref:tyrosine-type recombinase/integrase n=1 Tax=Roseovarius sp. TE539 TaxID=2249812 RepID=UPI0015EEDD0E|nr:tyrosine-type recombinase/integrase [Roseovarius sp. TE539]